MTPIQCVVIDDEIKLTESLSFALDQANIECSSANDAKAGLALVQKNFPDIVLLDVRLPDMSGLEALEKLIQTFPEMPVIMISAYGDTKDAVTAMKCGATDYLTKPFDVDELILLIRETIARKQLKNEVLYLRSKANSSSNFIGESNVILTLMNSVDQIAQSQVKVALISGETGVGKSLIAREIHERSDRKKAAFVEINCSSLPENLIEAELFGVTKGAYTGANNSRAGLVEIAEGGTLFLDEIGELPSFLQPKLLTLLESWRFRPVGATKEKEANIRIIAATNKNLEESIELGDFRKDLFFRLNIIPIQIPALRDREEDIWLLTTVFASTLSKREGQEPITIAPEVRAYFDRYNWPGNVRELKNAIERLTIMYPGNEIKPYMLPLEIVNYSSDSLVQLNSLYKVAPDIDPAQTIKNQMEIAERDLVLKALAGCGGKKGLTAEKLGISRHALKRRIQKLGIE